MTRLQSIDNAPTLAAAILTASLIYTVATAQKQPTVNEWDLEASSSLAVPVKPEIVLVGDEKTQNWIKFQGLANQWRDARGAMSSAAEMAMLPAYQGIIGMGKDAIPLILAELKAEGNAPDHWFWALAAIAHDNPVSPKNRGKLSEMAKAWLEWGQEQDYV